MTRRVAAVLVAARRDAEFPDARLRLAMIEDVLETVAELELLEPALALVGHDPQHEQMASLTWRGTAIHRLTDDDGPPVLRCLRALAATADQVTVVAPDVPDLPALLLGKLNRALGSAEVAVLPARGGGLVALAARCPLPEWLTVAGADLDAADALEVLRAAAPRRTALSIGPGWHRVRDQADLGALDPGLEGWDVTRGALRR